MTTKLTLFAQIISTIDRTLVKKLVKQYTTDKYCKGFSSWSHMVAMLFCHFAKSESVRDISNGLRSATGNLNHLGIETAPSKSTLSYQNKHRDYNLFKDLYFALYEQLGQHVHKEKIKFRIKSKIMLLDSTTISLCLSLFDWAKYKTTKGAIKMHTLLDYTNTLPHYVRITDGKTADNKGASEIPLIPQSVIVADRFYADFALLNIWDSNQVFFVVRHKENLKFEVVQDNPLPENKHPHLLKDEIILLTGNNTQNKYPKTLRRIAVWNDEHQMTIELITNQFKWSANTISELYKARWDVEIFFREIKQLLHIKSFIGTSANAVMIQIWSALISILILKYLKAKAKFSWHLSNLVAFIRLNIFVKVNLYSWLDNPFPNVKSPPKITVGTLFN